MGFDFSRLDAELAALGEVPANLAELARSYAGTQGSLADTDALLATLGAPVDLQAFAAPALPASPPRRAPAAPPPKSEEIALPEPVANGPSPASGELALDGAVPRSGSFALDDEPPPKNALDLGFE
jgi:hypothetical protein